MSSQREEKERLRLEREQRDRERQAVATRSRRLKLLGTVLAAAAAVVVIAIIASGSGGSKSNGAASKGGKVAEGSQVTARFNGIPQNGLVLGNPKAPVTMVEFADLKCPVCREYTLSAFPTLVNRYVRTGKVKMVLQLQHFVGNQNDDSQHAAEMALAVAKQNKLWNFADLFYYNQQNEVDTYVNDVFLRRIASAAPGLDVNKAFADRNRPTATQQLNQAANEFNTAGFTGTPSFAIGRTGSTLTPLNPSSFTDVSAFSGPIDKLLGSSAG
jgi:protein-disulfide isomerase